MLILSVWISGTLIFLLLVITWFDKKSHPTQVAFSLMNKKPAVSGDHYVYKFFNRTIRFIISLDEKGRIRRAGYLAKNPFLKGERALQNKLYLMNKFEIFPVNKSVGFGETQLDGIPIVTMWFIGLQSSYAIYEIESVNYQRYLTVEDCNWQDSLFSKHELKRFVVSRTLKERLLRVRQMQ